MTEKPKNAPNKAELTVFKQPGLTVFEKMVELADKYRCKLMGVVHRNLSGKLQEIALDLLHRTYEPLSALRDLTEARNKTERRRFIEDLSQLAKSGDIPQNPDVLYPGAGRDTSVLRVFQNTTNLDLEAPHPMPKDFNFVEADIRDMPFATASFDLIVSRGCNWIFDDSSVAAELARVLRQNGSIVTDQYFTDFGEEPSWYAHHITYIESQLQCLNALHTLHELGFNLAEQLANGTEIIRRQKPTPERESLVQQELVKNRELLFEYVANVDREWVPLVLEQFGIDESELISLPLEKLEEKLKTVKAGVPTETYQAVIKYLNESGIGIESDTVDLTYY